MPVTATRFQKTFGAGWSHYRVELEVWQEGGEPRSDCIIYHEPRTTLERKTGCQASLSCLEDTGYLENFSTGSMSKVEPGIVEDIAKWAKENGY